MKQVEELLAEQRKEIESGITRSLEDLALESGVISQLHMLAVKDSDAGSMVGDEEIPGFKLQDLLGRGSMGSVYRAWQTALNRTVAIKIMKPEHTLDRTLVQRFVSEAKALARLDHPNIVRAYILDEVNGFYYLAMEYLEGDDLRVRIEKEGRISELEAIQIGIQVAGALHHAHRNGIIHRDVKPSNIIHLGDKAQLAPGVRTVKLTDLGLARWKEIGGSIQASQHGMIVGTASYMSPEQIERPSEVDGRSDLYSLGACLYHMVCGQAPFNGAITQLMLQHVTEPMPDPRDFNPLVSAPMCGVLQKAMAKNPAQRYQTGLEFVAALREALQHHHYAAQMPYIPGLRMIEEIGPATQEGRTCVAEHVGMRRKVTVKVINSRLLRKPGRLEMALENVRATGRLRVPGLPPVHDCGFSAKGLFVVSDFVEGKSIAETKLDEESALLIAFKIAQMLKALSDAGLCHGSLIPGNVIIDKDNNPWLLHAGIRAGIGREPDDGRKRAADPLKRYLAPEVRVENAEASITSDIYSLGVILNDAMQMKPAVGKGASADESSARISDATGCLSGLLKSMTAKDAAERIQTVDKLIDAILETRRLRRFGAMVDDEVETARREQKPRAAPATPMKMTGGLGEPAISPFITQELPPIDLDEESESGFTPAVSWPPPGSAENAGGFILEVMKGPRKGVAFQLREGEALTFGRVRSDGVISLDDSAMSAPHFSVSLIKGEAVLTDCESKNGTFVNARSVTQTVLRTGDRIRVGRTTMVFRG